MVLLYWYVPPLTAPAHVMVYRVCFAPEAQAGVGVIRRTFRERSLCRDTGLRMMYVVGGVSTNSDLRKERLVKLLGADLEVWK